MPKLLVLPKNASVPPLNKKFAVLDIDVTSHSKTYGKELSPFFLPAVLHGIKYPCMENVWQYSKVYAEHLDSNSNIRKRWFDWSNAGMLSSKPQRYPMGKGAVPKFSFYDGERLDYIAARRNLYIPLYAKFAFKTQAFDLLQQLYKEKQTHIILRDFDAYNHDSLGMSYYDVIHNPSRKMGHGFVIAMGLTFGKNFHRVLR